MRLVSLFCFASIVVFFASCSSQKKISYYYLENVTDTSGKNAVKIFEPVIQKNDLLSIQVYSAATDPKVDALYNLANTNNTTNNPLLTGFLVDQNGNIEYPRIGIVHAEGLTKQQLADTIKLKLSSELKDPSVIIRYLNFRVTVLGEVGHAGTITIPYERVTVLEAIGLAGDIPFTGKKNSVRVIREANGNREIGTIDLTAKNVFDSPYFYLQQNDVVIVDPTKARIRSNEESIVTQRVTFALTFITAAALLYNLFK
jgi:polysaccharide export outer membrane protein